MKYINRQNFIESLKDFLDNKPFNHCIVEDFFEEEIALHLEKEFPAFESEIWHQYKSSIEVKKVCNSWNEFPPLTYKVFEFLNSYEFRKIIQENVFSGKKLYSDVGLNGGGWHIHKRGGKLNTHLDYSLHPKLGLQRKLNIIIYLNSHWKKNWGGDLGLWSNESDKHPGKLIKSIEPRFNRAIIFDTTQNSWHGLPEPLNCPKNEFRKSIAVYYLCEPEAGISKRGKALFAPSDEQKGDKEILELIKKRASVASAKDVYK